MNLLILSKTKRINYFIGVTVFKCLKCRFFAYIQEELINDYILIDGNNKSNISEKEIC